MKSHIENEAQSIDAIAEDLVTLAKTLDHRHRQQRKIQFFLDVRGYFVANRVSGAYVEFGVYRGEMMFSAHHVLNGTGCLTQYVGCDTFAGEPAFSDHEQAANPYLKAGDFASDMETTRAFLAARMGAAPLTLIQGDFRAADVGQRVRAVGTVALATVDCNVLSSVRAALEAVLPSMAAGGFLFMDDLFANAGGGRLETLDLLEACAAAAGRRLVAYHTYPPCARAYIVL